MMRRFYALVPLLVALILPIGSWAVDWNYKFTVNGIKYAQNGKEREVRYDLGGGAYNEVIAPEVEVIGLEDEAYAGELVIPEYVEYWLKDDKMGEAYLKSPVVGIAPSAFRRCSGLTSVVLPNSIEQIGEYSFASCTNLTSITFGNSLKTIGNHAFNVCKNLTSVYISDLAMWCNIKYGIDNDCDSHPLFSASEDKPTSLFLDGKEVRELIIPEDVTTIKDIAFIGCNRITSVKIPKSVTSIGALAFVNCNGLEKITTLIEQPFAIKATTFATFNMGSSEIINAILYVPVGTKEKYEATDGWKEFKNIVEMESENKDLKVGDTFTSDGILYTVITKQGEVQVGYYDETNNDYLPSIDKTTEGVLEIPAVVTGSDGKSYSVTRIGKSAFEGCQALSTVTLPNSITSIGKFAFKGCIGLTSLTIPNSVKDIEHFAFTGCSNLVTIDIPASVTSIGQSVFRNCTSLVSVSIPNSVLSIGYAIFDGCKSLSTVMSYIEIPFAIELPGETARMLYEMNTTLYVPAGTKALYEATDGWKEFKNIVEMTPYDVLDDNTVTAHFLQPDEEGKVEIPATVEIDGKTYTVTEIAAGAFKDNKELKEVTIPGTVTKIGDGAFAGCENLRAIYVFAPEPISLTAAEPRNMVTRAADNVPSQFEGIDFDACTLYVPIGSEQKYREAEGWKLFTNIVGVADPSGITTVLTETKSNAAVYNLSGQRLTAPQKGLNIIGGKKVVVR